ncbi:MAG TPA: SIS domain-containing protein [Desulfobacteraceae bacterium]|nr:SIS domain-containing protein [Desulfobacteraceae bacterium]
MEKIFQDSIHLKQAFLLDNTAKIARLAEEVASAFAGNRKLMICGNGGSAADSQHIAAEFINRYIIERPPLPAIALTTDTSVLTSVGNDYSFDLVFFKQVKALGMAGDVLLTLSTSGGSENVRQAVLGAREMGIYTAAFLGGNGGSIADEVDLAIVVNSSDTPRIQEIHITAGHALCHLVDHILFSDPSLNFPTRAG